MLQIHSFKPDINRFADKAYSYLHVVNINEVIKLNDLTAHASYINVQIGVISSSPYCPFMPNRLVDMW